MKKWTIFCLFQILCITTVTFAQSTSNSDDKGVYLGMSLIGTSWNVPDFDLESERGGGLGLRFGYNFNTNFALFLSLDGAKIEPDDEEEYALGHVDIGAEGRFGDSSNALRPFLRGSLVGMAAVSDDPDGDVEISGAGVGVGAGIYYFIPNSGFSLSVDYTHSWINLNEVKVGPVSVEIDEDAESGRFSFGAAYHF